MCSTTDVPPPTDGSVSVVALNEAGKVRVTWSRPTLRPGQVITGYSVQYRRRGSTSYTNHSESINKASYTINNLTLGTVYEVRVALRGRLGLSGYCCGSGKQVTTFNCEYISTIERISIALNIGCLLYMLLACRNTAKMPLWLGGGKLNQLLNFTRFERSFAKHCTNCQVSSSVAGTKEKVVHFIRATMVLIEGGCDSRGLYFIV